MILLDSNKSTEGGNIQVSILCTSTNEDYYKICRNKIFHDKKILGLCNNEGERNSFDECSIGFIEFGDHSAMYIYGEDALMVGWIEDIIFLIKNRSDFHGDFKKLIDSSVVIISDFGGDGDLEYGEKIKELLSSTNNKFETT